MNQQSSSLSFDDVQGVVLMSVPCAGCGYLLKGVEAQHNCPECGRPLWSTLRLYVDPKALHLAPLTHPYRIAVSLVVLMFAFLLTAALLWAPVCQAVVDRITLHAATWRTEMFSTYTVAAASVLMLGLTATLFLARPLGGDMQKSYRHGLFRLRLGLVLIITAMLMGALAFQPWKTGLESIQTGAEAAIGVVGRIIWIVIDMGIIESFIGLRAVNALLSSRSLRHRMGHSSRQGMLTIAAAAGVILLGHILLVASGVVNVLSESTSWQSLPPMIGSALVGVGGGMVTLALLNATADSLRLGYGLVHPVYRLDEMIGSI